MDAELWLSETGRGKDRWMVCALVNSPAEVRRMAVGQLVAELESGNPRAAVWLDNARLRPTAAEIAVAREPYRRAERGEALATPTPKPHRVLRSARRSLRSPLRSLARLPG